MRLLPSVQRRGLLQAAGFAGLSMVALRANAAALPDPLAAFEAKTFGEAVGALGGALAPSPLISLDAPSVADNGAVVPVTVSSALQGTREILLLVDGNPQPVAARFTIPAGTEAFVATRIRMAGSGTLYAAVRTESGVYAAASAISVTVGGCG
ncbi:MAG: thiosulfate oxidation carrier protein SoxY [Burkholderiales bacterium]|jgi:sulfur-oxidizing protein SoxY